MEFAAKKTAEEIYSVILRDMSAYGGFPFYGALILFSLLLNEFRFASDLFVSLIVVTIVVAGVRLLYFKPRPGMKKKKYTTLYERIDNSSFPSIHVARAFILTGALYTKFPTAMPLLLLLIVAVALSRLHFRRHDLKDITAGAVIGFVIGLIFF